MITKFVYSCRLIRDESNLLGTLKVVVFTTNPRNGEKVISVKKSDCGFFWRLTILGEISCMDGHPLPLPRSSLLRRAPAADIRYVLNSYAMTLKGVHSQTRDLATLLDFGGVNKLGWWFCAAFCVLMQSRCWVDVERKTFAVIGLWPDFNACYERVTSPWGFSVMIQPAWHECGVCCLPYHEKASGLVGIDTHRLGPVSRGLTA